MPKGGTTSLIPVYAGLQSDLDTFLKAFLRLESRRFVDYKHLFKHLGMIKLFHGRSEHAEIIEFNEHLLAYCQPYMSEYYCHDVKRSLEERLFGLYSTYTFFYLQQVNHVVKIKMNPYAFESFSSLFDLLFDEEILDAVLCFSKLYKDKAFKFVAYTSAYDPTCFKWYRTDENLNGLPVEINVNDPLGNMMNMLKSPIFSELGVAHEEYMRIRKAFALPDATSFPQNPQKALKTIVRKCIEETGSQIAERVIVKQSSSTKQSGNRLLIKQKAYQAQVRLPKFLKPETSQVVTTTGAFDFAENAAEESKISNQSSNRLSVKESVYQAKKFPKFLKSETSQVIKSTKTVDFVERTIVFQDEDEKYTDSANSKEAECTDTNGVIRKPYQKGHSPVSEPEIPEPMEKRKRGRPRKIKSSDEKSELCDNKVMKKMKTEKNEAPVKPSGRRTNNSLASELFFLEDHSVAEQNTRKDANEVKVVAKVPVDIPSEPELVEMEVDHPEKPAAPPKKSMIKTTFGASKTVKFKQEKTGEVVVVIHEIPLRNYEMDEHKGSEDTEEDDMDIVWDQRSEDARLPSTSSDFSEDQFSQENNYPESLKTENNKSVEAMGNIEDTDGIFVPLENEKQLLEEESDDGFEISVEEDLDDEYY